MSVEAFLKPRISQIADHQIDVGKCRQGLRENPEAGQNTVKPALGITIECSQMNSHCPDHVMQPGVTSGMRDSAQGALSDIALLKEERH